MKNKNFIAGIAMFYFLLLATALTVSGQQPNVSLSDQMDYLIAPLDFTEVTSGLLLDRGFRMMNVEDFDGTSTADTLIQYGDWFRYPNRLLDTVQSRIMTIAIQAPL